MIASENNLWIKSNQENERPLKLKTLKHTKKKFKKVLESGKTTHDHGSKNLMFYY